MKQASSPSLTSLGSRVVPDGITWCFGASRGRTGNPTGSKGSADRACCRLHL